MNRDADVLAALLARRGDMGADLTTADADALAAYLAGALEGEEAEAFEARLAEDDTLRAVWRELALAPAAAAPPKVAWRPRVLAAAAVLLVAVGVFWFARGRESATPADLVARLAALATSDPELFADLGFDPRAVPVIEAPRERGGLALLSPRGLLLHGRPTLRWRTAGAVDGVEVVVEREDDGAIVLTRRTSEALLAWPAAVPPLEAGQRYLWSVSGEGAHGKQNGGAVIEVASPERAAGFSGRLAAMARSPQPVDALLAAHLAAAEGLLVESERRLVELRGIGTGLTANRDALLAYVRARLAGAR